MKVGIITFNRTINYGMIMDDIDYSEVNKIIGKKKQEALGYLKSSLRIKGKQQ